jgi:HD-GYP domain-containing protein (c-di-GMP phosphodiesterase class II)
MDGTGYPEGLAGDAIPIEARILAVADAYEAMTAERAYRPAMSAEAAQQELVRCSGSQFDPDVVDAFLRILRPGDGVGTLVLAAEGRQAPVERVGPAHART